MKLVRRLAVVAALVGVPLAFAAPANAEAGPVSDLGQCTADTAYFVESGLEFYLPLIPGNPGEAYWLGLNQVGNGLYFAGCAQNALT
jgi:hypothetical protein